MRRGAMTVAFFVVALMLGSCARTDDDVVLVMAAASLTDAFQEIEKAFEKRNPGLDVQLNLAGSASLREQILQGAPADVFAAANATTMMAVINEGAAAEAQAFATNRLQLATPLSNPGNVQSLADLQADDLLVGLCAVGVPCGDAARDALNQAGVVAAVDTNERDARALLTKIEAGELDAGVVYATDVSSSTDVIGLDLPASVDVRVTYPIATLAEAPNAPGAQAFVAFVLSPSGRLILDAHGFGP